MMESLVTAEWLAAELGADDLVVLDCTVRIEFDESGMHPVSGLEAFESAHIPGARFADLLVDLSDPAKPIGWFAVPTADAFCAAMEQLGVGDDRRVVVYDSSMSVWAARVWWMLRWVGFDQAALLDGGLAAWTRAGHPTDVGPASVASRAQLTARPRPELIADRDTVLAAIDDDAVTIVDTLDAGHYSGASAMYDRPGHIPGAVNVPCFDLLDAEQCLVDDPAVIERHGPGNGSVITYCGGGIAASLNAFALTRAGVDDVAVYTASLQEWASDPANPLVTGDEP